MQIPGGSNNRWICLVGIGRTVASTNGPLVKNRETAALLRISELLLNPVRAVLAICSKAGNEQQ